MSAIADPAERWPATLVRQTFIDFFVQKQEHTFYRSNPVVPVNDPTLLFTNAGMNQFKPIFLGQVDPTSPLAKLKRACNSQKCIRAGGKHNDLEDVGKDVYHHTFFEMLGNWSFGDFFKKEVIAWAWELLTEVYGIDPDRLYVTYFEGDDAVPCDDEARDMWLKFLPPSRVIPFDAKDNFWEMGDTGPCGPCCELHYDRIGGRDAAALVNMDDPDVLEVWNLVFIQYNRKPSGALEELPAQHVDTGMGFERLTSVLQNKRSNYDTDIFMPLFAEIKSKAGEGVPEYGGKVGKDDVGNIDMAYRVVADHIRTLTFAITDGATPANAGRGYVLRRVLRRGVRYGHDILKMEKGFFSKLVPIVVETMKGAFPELESKEQFVTEVILDEELSFGRTLKKGLDFFNKTAEKAQAAGETEISGEDAFFLYATMGFPADLTELMAEERGMTLDMEGYSAQYAEHQNVSKGGGKTRAEGPNMVLESKQTVVLEEEMKLAATEVDFKYTSFAEELDAKVLAIYDGAAFVQEAAAGGVFGVVLDRSNFYAEQGGQMYDSGTLTAAGASFAVDEVQTYKGFQVHIGQCGAGSEGLKVGDAVKCSVDLQRRIELASNHTMTHVLNFGLRKVLGGEVDQKGSLVAPDKLRFDFNALKALTADQLAQVERIAQARVDAALPVNCKVVPLADARRITSLRAVFGETYPDPVRVVIVGKTVEEVIADPTNAEWADYSVELCGGTHLTNTAQSKAFALVEEEAISKGVRRVVCLTGEAAIDAAAKAEVIGAMLEDSKCVADGPELIAAQKQISAAVDAATISAATKAELRKELKKLTKRVLAYNKKLREATAALVDVETKTIAEALAAGKPAFHIVVYETNATLAAKCCATLAKGAAETSLCVLMRDEASGKFGVSIKMSKAHQGGGVEAKAWLDAISAAAGCKGGGKKDKANGQGALGMVEKAEAAAREFTVGK